MSAFENESFDGIKTWYAEWSRIPTYVATIAFAAIAFSVTELLNKREATSPVGNVCYLKASWLCLGVSALLASIGIFLIYMSFDLTMRIHLKNDLGAVSMKAPRENTLWIRRFGIGSWCCTLAAMVFLLFGAGFLILFALSKLRA